MAKFCIDANILMTAWNTSYPIDVFPTLWESLAAFKDDIIIIKPIFDEIGPLSAYRAEKDIDKLQERFALRIWLLDNNFTETRLTEEDELLALELEREYQVTDSKKGVGTIDIKLIAYAKNHLKTVVTLENQPTRPKEISKCKIPTVCKDKLVSYTSFIELIREFEISL